MPQPWFPPGFRICRKPGSFWVLTVAIPAVRETSVAAPLCCGCRERDARIAELQQQVVALQTQNRKLGESARRNASNSSIPPSSNPPDAPKPTTKKPTGRKRGSASVPIHSSVSLASGRRTLRNLRSTVHSTRYSRRARRRTRAFDASSRSARSRSRAPAPSGERARRSPTRWCTSCPAGGWR